jgi:hypothetical protein
MEKLIYGKGYVGEKISSKTYEALINYKIEITD